MTRRLQVNTADLKNQILKNKKNYLWIALAVDESTEKTAKAQLLTFGRFLKESCVTENCLLAFHLKLLKKVRIC